MNTLQPSELSVTSIDRPDVTKDISNPRLSFKQVKDVFFKFLTLLELEFSGEERYCIYGDFNSKTIDHEPIKVINTYCTVTATLPEFRVEGRKVLVKCIQDSYHNLPQRAKSNIKLLQLQEKVVVFDLHDWTKLGIITADNSFLHPLTKKQVTNFVDLLYKKINNLKGNKKSSVTLNDCYYTIDKMFSKKDRNSYLEDEVYQLKSKLIYNKLSTYFDLTSSHLKIVEAICRIDSNSVEFMEEVFNTIMPELNKVNLRYNVYKPFFHNKDYLFDYKSYFNLLDKI